MGGFEDVDEAIQAGALGEDADVDSSAAINPVKTEKRKIYISFFLNTAVRSGAGVDRTTDGMFPGIILPNANAGTIIMSWFGPRAEVISGEKAFLHIWWNTVGTSNELRLVTQIRPQLAGVKTRASVVTRNKLEAPQSVANTLQESILEYPPSIFSTDQMMSLQIDRDPANALDTLASDVNILAVYFEMLGRC